MLVRLVHEIGHDLWDVSDRRKPVGIQRLGQIVPVAGSSSRSSERVWPSPWMIPPSTWLDAPSGLITRPTSWIAAILLDTHLARLDVDGDLGDLYSEGQHPHAGRVRATRALAEDLPGLEQAGDLLEGP